MCAVRNRGIYFILFSSIALSMSGTRMLLRVSYRPRLLTARACVGDRRTVGALRRNSHSDLGLSGYLPSARMLGCLLLVLCNAFIFIG
ncbi:hypothetical protein V1522DRAFT_86499 [Lipomyces starkeyi]